VRELAQPQVSMRGSLAVRAFLGVAIAAVGVLRSCP
jgi:hypothetical protein